MVVGVRQVAAAASVALALLGGSLGGSLSGPGGLADGRVPPTSDGPVEQFRLSYLNTDTDPHNPNALDIAQHAAGDGPLLLFLPATGAVPSDYQDFLDTAVSEGFNVLGLDYWNLGKSVTRTCGPDARCYGQVQRNRFNGTHPSRFSKVDAQNSIKVRFYEAIRHLERADSAGDWQRFLDGQSPNWHNLVLAGHSQGGGESAYLSHFHAVKGVLMFSSPVETYDDVTANWVDANGKTPPSRMYGFDDINDVYFQRITQTWPKLGMGTADAAAATAVPTGSHVLLSSLMIGDPLQSHDRSVDDSGPRSPDDSPRFERTWVWMLRQVK